MLSGSPSIFTSKDLFLLLLLVLVLRLMRVGRILICVYNTNKDSLLLLLLLLLLIPLLLLRSTRSSCLDHLESRSRAAARHRKSMSICTSKGPMYLIV